MRISLSHADFRTLVRGGIVKTEGVEIALADIGFTRMAEEVKSAMETSFCPICRATKALTVALKNGKCPECGNVSAH